MASVEEHVKFPQALVHLHAVERVCQMLRKMSVTAFDEAVAETDCMGADTSDCIRYVATRVAGQLLQQWHEGISGKLPFSAASVAALDAAQITFRANANSTWALVGGFAGRARHAIQRTASELGTGDTYVRFPSGARANPALAELSLTLSKNARLLVDHARTAWAVRMMTSEVERVYRGINRKLPQFQVDATLYGRHWDMLEWLLDGLIEERGHRLSMVELGVACGCIGLHLLPRFPQLQYVGADPAISPVVRAAYQFHERRAVLVSKTSAELNQDLPPDALFDFVFVDGPHTYENVKNDLKMWLPRVRQGGVIAGHDFTCAHPPLLWAVTESMIEIGARSVNLGMDGVWWWRVV